jgi:hypothetical protein
VQRAEGLAAKNKKKNRDINTCCQPDEVGAMGHARQKLRQAYETYMSGACRTTWSAQFVPNEL